jgi:hypothetical protein
MSQYGQFLLNYSDASMRAGDAKMAINLLDEAISTVLAVLEKNENNRESLEHIGLAAFQWWQLNGDRANPIFGRYAIDLQDGRNSTWSCDEAALAARQAILKGDRGTARVFTQYLLDKGYADPGFKGFCRQYDLCS